MRLTTILLGLPHTRGGEPYAIYLGDCCEVVFPTRVGVNRTLIPFVQAHLRLPHTRGGEPFGVISAKPGEPMVFRIVV